MANRVYTHLCVYRVSWIASTDYFFLDDAFCFAARSGDFCYSKANTSCQYVHYLPEKCIDI